MKKLLILVTLYLLVVSSGFSQTIVLEGYAYETGNRGYLNVVSVTATDLSNGAIIGNVFSNLEGYFSLEVPANSKIKLSALKDMFESIEQEVSTGSEKTFVKLEMRRTPGYIFEITLAHKKENDEIPTDAIKDARIEVYNNTTKREELVLEAHPNPEFRVNLIKGNHYTILIRKEGYLAKRMEAFVDVEGCILCFEGVGQVQPGVSENLTEGNEFGVLLANIEMEKVFSGKKIEIQNIYFDLGKYDIKRRAAEELDKVITLLMDNPELTIEMGSHTDSRGTSESNQILSEQRAKATVDYLLTNGDIRKNRMYYFGYGETQLVNDCADGVTCSEKKHAMNRRTELKVLNIKKEVALKTLKQMKEEEEMERLILGLGDQEQIKVKEGESLEDKIKEDEATKIVEAQSDPVMIKAHTNPPIWNGSTRYYGEDGNPLNGAIVVIFSSSRELPKGHEIYNLNDSILYLLDKDGSFLYYLPYKSKKAAEFALQKSVKEMYPRAYVLTYKDGYQID